MNHAQLTEIEWLQKELNMDAGTLRRLALETFPGDACGVRSIRELSRFQADELILALRLLRPSLILTGTVA